MQSFTHLPHKSKSGNVLPTFPDFSSLLNGISESLKLDIFFNEGLKRS